MSLWKDKEMLKQAVRDTTAFGESFIYNEKITLYPVKIRNYIDFSLYKTAITINKESDYPYVDILKMSYWRFLTEMFKNPELRERVGDSMAGAYLIFVLKLMGLVCRTENISVNENEKLVINGCEISDDEFDDLRRIIFIQNDVDFDIDNFVNAQVKRGLKRVSEKLRKSKDESTFEDYIDSLAVVMNLNCGEIEDMTIRKFWRYITRINMRDDYTICRMGEVSGFAKFKSPIPHWMISPNEDKNGNLKSDAQTYRN